MKVTEQDVVYVSELAHLELTPAERERMLRDLNSILDYISRLNELDTSNVEPMSQVSPSCGGQAVLRADEPRPSLARDSVMKHAPETDGALFKVPKVIER